MTEKYTLLEYIIIWSLLIEDLVKVVNKFYFFGLRNDYECGKSKC